MSHWSQINLFWSNSAQNDGKFTVSSQVLNPYEVLDNIFSASQQWVFGWIAILVSPVHFKHLKSVVKTSQVTRASWKLIKAFD